MMPDVLYHSMLRLPAHPQEPVPGQAVRFGVEIDTLEGQVRVRGADPQPRTAESAALGYELSLLAWLRNTIAGAITAVHDQLCGILEARNVFEAVRQRSPDRRSRCGQR